MPEESRDRRTKVRPHVKIYLDTRTHRKTGACFADPEFRGQLLGLFMIARDREPGPDGTTVYVNARDIAWITGKDRTDRAFAALIDLCWVMEFPMRVNEIEAVRVNSMPGGTPTGFRDPDPEFLKAEVRATSGGGRVLVQALGVLRGRLANVRSRFATGLTRVSRNFAAILLPNYPEKQLLRFPGWRHGGPEPHISIGSNTKEDQATEGSDSDPGRTKSGQTTRETPLHQVHARVRNVWPQLVERAARYGKTWGKEVGQQRVKFIGARVAAGASEDDLLTAIDGYVAARGTEVVGDFDPMKFLRPETIYQASKFEYYLEEGRAKSKRAESPSERHLRELRERLEREESNQNDKDF